MLGDEQRDLVRQPHALRLCLLPEDRGLGLQVGGLDVRDQAPFETGPEALLQRGDLAGDPIRADDDLLGRVVEVVKGVKEFLLGPLLAGDELDVVDQQEVEAPVAVAELDGGVEPDGVPGRSRARKLLTLEEQDLEGLVPSRWGLQLCRPCQSSRSCVS